jgi:hypothetical protein
MLRPVVTLAAAGVVGIALWKILSILLLPLAGMLFGLLLTLLKVGLLVALVMFAVWLFRRKDKEKGGEASAG